MSTSREPRHWFGVVVALALTVVAVLQFADFSGEPAPRWREIAMSVLAPLCLLTILFNMIKDKQSDADA